MIGHHNPNGPAWDIGERVYIDDDPCVGRITAILFRDRGIQYEISWMSGGSARSAWIEEWRLSEPYADPVGFAVGGTTWTNADGSGGGGSWP